MLKNVIVPQLVDMLSSENSPLQSKCALILSKLGQYGEHELTWKSFSTSDSFVEDMRALMPKNVIVAQLVDMLSSEKSQLQSSGAYNLSWLANYGEHRLT